MKKSESQASAKYCMLIGCFVHITPNVKEVATQKYVLVVFVT